MFKNGLLYVRVFNGEPSELFFPTKDVPEDYRNFYAKNIAEIRHGEASPNFCGYVECARDEEHTGSGNLVEFHIASDGDIRTFLDKWPNDESVSDWSDSVQSISSLLDSEKERVARIAMEY
jgi:hypothetical protein